MCRLLVASVLRVTGGTLQVVYIVLLLQNCVEQSHVCIKKCSILIINYFCVVAVNTAIRNTCNGKCLYFSGFYILCDFPFGCSV